MRALLKRAWARALRFLSGLSEPSARKITYAAVAFVVAAIGITLSPDQTDALVAVAVGVLMIVRAILNAQSVTARLVYALLAAVAALAMAYGWAEGRAVASMLGIISTVLGAGVAALRTDPTTPTGEPALEYAARHVSPDRLP